MAVVVIIPAHLGSTRLPKKALVDVRGKSLLQRCYESVVHSGFVPVIATPDNEIQCAARSFGAEVVKTSTLCKNGTERVGEAAQLLGLSDETIVVNCQSDMFGWKTSEFLTNPIEKLEFSKNAMITVYCPHFCVGMLNHKHVVKVTWSIDGKSKQQFHFTRQTPHDNMTLFSTLLGVHFGLYVSYKKCFDAYKDLPPTPEERAHSLEQLRWNIPIDVVEIPDLPAKVDCVEDLYDACRFVEKVEEMDNGPY